MDHLHTIEKKRIITFSEGPGSQVYTTQHEVGAVAGKWRGDTSIRGIAEQAQLGYAKDGKPKWVRRVGEALAHEGKSLSQDDIDLISKARRIELWPNSARP
jgi:hypothetical protein